MQMLPKKDPALVIIERCEADLGYKLSPGQCRDLLMDNTDWTRAEIVEAVRAIRGDAS